jgi:putative PIN family toxin of toxin-antitoxin system
MKTRERVVVDTNALVSRPLLPNSIPGRAVRRVLDDGRLLVSEETLAEIAHVLGRVRFDRYVTLEDRQQFLRLLTRIAEFIPVVAAVQACRDPDNDKFLALAVSGNASTIVTGDDDLLILNPFQGITIESPAAYLSRVPERPTPA